MGPLQALSTILPLALTSGINLYLTILVVGLSIRLGWVPDAPAGLHVLATLPVLIVAGVFYVIEFFADKIAFVDNLWDLIHTFIRPVGAIVIATAGLSGIDPAIVDATASVTGVDPAAGIFAALMAGVVALIAHGGKAGTRTVVNVASPAETLTNIAISLIEDLAVALLVFLALRYPTTANVISVIILVIIIIFVPQLLRWAWFTLKAIWAWLRSFVQPLRQSEQLPPTHAALLHDQSPDLAAHCQAQNIRPARGRWGYAALLDDTLFFTYDHWFRSRAWHIGVDQITSAGLRRRPLVDVLEVHYHDEQHRPGTARFAFTRDRRPLVEQFVRRLGEIERVTP